MHVLTLENDIVKPYEYALDWIESKGFDWCLRSTITVGTPYWLVDDESWALAADIPAERLAEVFDFTAEPDGVVSAERHTRRRIMLKLKSDIVESLKKESKATAIRAERDRLFTETVDRLNSARWESLSENQRNAWKEYRQALCDITKQTTFPESVVYPKMPE